MFLTNFYYISKSVIINKQGGYSTDNSTLYNIIGTGASKIIVNNNITVIDTEYDFSHFICFKGIKFISIDANLNAYVFNRKFIRLFFVNCDFYKIKAVCADEYLQTIYFTNCNIRKWNEVWFETKLGLYDVRFNQCVFENDGYGTAIKAYGKIGIHMISQLDINSCLLEGLNYGVVYANTMNLNIIGCYFEGNSHGDIVSYDADVNEFNYGVNIHNNIFYSANLKTDNTDGNGIWSIIWARTINGTAFGNTAGNDLGLHYIGTESRHAIHIFGERTGGTAKVCNKEYLIRNTYNGNSSIDATNRPVTKNYGDIVINTNQLLENGNIDKKSNIGWLCVDPANDKYREIGLNNKLTKFTNTYASGITGALIEKGYSGFIALGRGDGLTSYRLYFIDGTKVMQITTSERVPDCEFYERDGYLIIKSVGGTLNLLAPNYIEITSLTTTELTPYLEGAIQKNPILEKMPHFSSSNRPLNLTTTDVGYQGFDSTLKKPIWWTGSAWVDATGATV